MEQNMNGELISSLDRVMRLLRRRPQKDQSFGRGTFRILRIIEKEGEISTKRLAEKLEIRTSSLNEKLPKLEEELFIERKRDEKDQRVFVVSLLEKGQKHLEEIREDRRDFLNSFPGVLSEEEIIELKRLLDKLASGMEEVMSEKSAP